MMGLLRYGRDRSGGSLTVEAFGGPGRGRVGVYGMAVYGRRFMC